MISNRCARTRNPTLDFAQQGTTLLEILFTLAIITILTSIASPSFSALMNKASIETVRNHLYQDLRLIRSAAMTRHKPTYLWGLDKQGNPSKQTHWDSGWIGFVDNNLSLHYDLGDEMITEYRNNDYQRISVILHAVQKNIKINERGRSVINGHFRVCDPKQSKAQAMTLIQMNAKGKLALGTEKKACR